MPVTREREVPDWATHKLSSLIAAHGQKDSKELLLRSNLKPTPVLMRAHTSFESCRSVMGGRAWVCV